MWSREAYVLRREFDADPEPETTRLYEEIRTQQCKPKRQKKSAVTPSVSQTAIRARRVRWRWVTATVLAFLFVVVATTVASIYIWEKAPLIDEIKKGFLEPPLPSKPSIVVLPFENLSPDAAHEFFTDGITADIITELSRYPGLFVISRYSSFTYKDRVERVQTVATELGVQYVVEGSVQRKGPMVRISVQLIDATTGRHLWAGRHDRQIEDVFLLQDEVTQKIVASLAVETSDAELKRIRRKDTSNLAAYEYVLQGREFNLRFTKDSNARARRMYETAIALDPNYPRALSYLAWTHLNDYSLGWSIDPRQSLMRAFELTKKAVALDPSNPDARAALGDTYLWTKRFDRAIQEYEIAMALNPSDANNYAGMGDVLTWAGKPKQAVEHLEKAVRLHTQPHSRLELTQRRQFRSARAGRFATRALRDGP